jgi:hypothetical protein
MEHLSRQKEREDRVNLKPKKPKNENIITNTDPKMKKYYNPYY